MARGVTAQQTPCITECGPGSGQEVTTRVEGIAGFASGACERRRCWESEGRTKYGGTSFPMGRCFGFAPQAQVIGALGNLGWGEVERRLPIFPFSCRVRTYISVPRSPAHRASKYRFPGPRREGLMELGNSTGSGHRGAQRRPRAIWGKDL